VNGENKVRFNEYVARVVASSRTEMKVIVPVALNRSESVLSVEVNARTHVFQKKFLLLAPVITSFTPSTGGMGAVVTIRGLNFSPALGGNMVSFGDRAGRVTSAHADKITVTVPDGLHADQQVKITVNVVGQSVTSKETFSIR
ncbi:MAG: IPT/TIG domain-containing protein, partial [Bacteroidota bacterium]|nr:IPT/TIG domain-containing protein [Bacteroidota bacterium]